MISPAPTTSRTPQVCIHTWAVSAFTVTLIADFTPGAPASRNEWHPFQPNYFTPGMEAEYQTGLRIAIAKFRAARGEAPAMPSSASPAP